MRVHKSSWAILLEAPSGVGEKPPESRNGILESIDGVKTTNWNIGEGSREETGTTKSRKGSINLSEGVAVWKGKFSSWNITSWEIKICLVITSYNL